MLFPLTAFNCLPHGAEPFQPQMQLIVLQRAVEVSVCMCIVKGMCSAAYTSSWEKVVSIFVEGHGHDAVSQVKGFLYTVTVMNVDVNVEDSGVVSENQAPLKTRTHEQNSGCAGLTLTALVCWWQCHSRNRIQTPADTNTIDLLKRHNCKCVWPCGG